MARNMKILVLHPKSWVTGGYDTICGCEVKHVEIGGAAPTRLDGSVSEDGIGQKMTERGMEDLMTTAYTFKPDVILMGIHFGLTPGVLKAAKRAGGGSRLVMHYTDQRDGVPKEVSQYAGVLDLLLITNRDEEEFAKYQDAGFQVDTFYDGFDPREYYPSPMPALNDAMFGGNNFAGLVREIRERNMDIPAGISFDGAEFRERFIVGAHKLLGDRLRVLGNYGWTAAGIPYEPPVYHPKYITVMHSAKVILSTVNAQRRGLLTRRLWRSVASGRLYLTEYIDGMESHFQDGVHLAWFKTVEEGLDKLRFYLDDDEARERVARAGVKLLNSKHTYQHRLCEFKQTIRRAL